MLQVDTMTEVIDILAQGGLILFPTDTTWCIGCDGTDLRAIERIYHLTKSDQSKPFELLVDSLDMLKAHVEHIHPRIETLLSHHSRPLTVVYDKGKNLPDITMDIDGSIAVRVSKDSFCKTIIETFGKPLITTNANVNNTPIPGNYGFISSDIIIGVDHVVKLRQMEKKIGAPSVMVRLSEKHELIFLRE